MRERRGGGWCGCRRRVCRAAPTLAPRRARWDWHVAQALIACLPAAAVLALSSAARERRAGDAVEPGAAAAGPGSSEAAAAGDADALAALAERVARLEAREPAASQPPAPGPPPPPPPVPDRGPPAAAVSPPSLRRSPVAGVWRAARRALTGGAGAFWEPPE